MSEKQYRDKIAQLLRQRAEEEKTLGAARKAGNNHRADAAKELAKIRANTSVSMAQSYRRRAESLLKRAESEDAKVIRASGKIAQIARDLSTAETNLEREIRQTSSREEQRRKQQERQAAQAASRRQQAERAHAQELARLARQSSPQVRVIRMLPPPRPEPIRILYLTANPEMNLRTEAEVRAVRAEVQKATHRDSVAVDFRAAATPEDLLDGLNQMRPHVVHFSGHAGNGGLLFDNGSVDAPEGRDVEYQLLAQALVATDMPPQLLVLNGCETLGGADVLLEAVGVVIGMADSISDLAANVFAARFYAAIAEAQPVAAALAQGSVAIDLARLAEGWKPQVLARPEIELETWALIQAE